MGWPVAINQAGNMNEKGHGGSELQQHLANVLINIKPSLSAKSSPTQCVQKNSVWMTRLKEDTEAVEFCCHSLYDRDWPAIVLNTLSRDSGQTPSLMFHWHMRLSTYKPHSKSLTRRNASWTARTRTDSGVAALNQPLTTELKSVHFSARHCLLCVGDGNKHLGNNAGL